MAAEYNKAEADFFIVALKEEARSVLWKVGSNTDPETLVKGVMEDLQALARSNDGTDTRTDEEIWIQVRERLLKAAYETRPHCIRCGECCSNGSPTLLAEDIALFRNDTLKPADIVTIRCGEPVYSNREEKADTAQAEMIKIRENAGEKTCAFYQKWDKSCSIYESRPQQCHKQECWNPEASEEFVESARLDRKILLEAVPPLWELIKRHEERCSHDEFARSMARLSATKGQTVEEVLEMLRFDYHVREFIAENFGLAPESLEFFLGRPLSAFLGLYGLKLEEEDGSFILSPVE
ncbi:MAG: YkgJ family cysteine cluster protein [Desulfomonile tiedjei]|uniref:YkgJ family cysteine cluster protein n=1 Tax=Desulfomonile tiedjei TaxID=2358 RepID=A0A9D6Z372_9BACT|nr:YkgJ family cysteine cluster protein [Desulfomonile tiedjei]